MRSWFLGAVGVCLFATLATDVVRGADKVPFSYSFAKGDTWQYESVDNQQIALNDNMLLNSRITTKFRFDVVGSSMLGGGGPMPLPRPERDPRPQQRDDGLMEMKVSIASFGPCLNRSGERLVFRTSPTRKSLAA